LPGTKSAQKQARVAERRRIRNKSIRSLCKTNITKAENLIFSGELELARRAVVLAISSLDKAAVKGVIHANNADRRKSRLMKKLNEALAASAPETEPKEAG
jgi:small subunit ribosomal protein S20